MNEWLKSLFLIFCVISTVFPGVARDTMDLYNHDLGCCADITSKNPKSEMQL